MERRHTTQPALPISLSVQDVGVKLEGWVSIVIVSYNSQKTIFNCLHSIVENTILDQVEIILVDNASEDDSAKFVEVNYPCVQVVHSNTNLGFGGGCNLGASYANGQFLAFLNPDTQVEPGWLVSLIGILEENKTVGLVTSKILLLNCKDKLNTCGNEVHFTGLTLCRGYLRSGCEFENPEEVGAVSGAAFVIRHDLFTRLNGFDTDFFVYLEDTDLSLRARLSGYTCIYNPDSLVYHQYSIRHGSQKLYYQERNRYLMLMKVFTPATLFILLPALILSEVIAWGFLLLYAQQAIPAKLSAHLWIIQHLGDIRRKHQQTQRFRRVTDRDLLKKCCQRVAFELFGSGLAVRFADRMINPLFSIAYRVCLSLIHW